jgi:CRISPR/Cas system Type II protein with McrA/HNH and RuvC-like nuclease domain
MSAGYFEIHEELYEVLLELGPIIVGEESILSNWATYTERAAGRITEAPDLDQKTILNILTQSHHDIRDTQEIRKLVLQKEGLNRCVWSGNKLTENNMHVDHVIPFSVWQNNELWNLLPATNTINSNKSDKIPTPGLITRSGERILEIWSIYRENFGDRFLREAFNGLGYKQTDDLNSALDALKFKSEYLIEKRGMPAFEGK